LLLVSVQDFFDVADRRDLAALGAWQARTLFDPMRPLEPGYAGHLDAALRELQALDVAALERLMGILCFCPGVETAREANVCLGFLAGWTARRREEDAEREGARRPGRPRGREALPALLFEAFFSHVGEPWNPSDDPAERGRIEQCLGRELALDDFQEAAARLSKRSPHPDWRVEKVGKHERRSGGSWRLVPANPESRTKTYPSWGAYDRAKKTRIIPR
jgi:hypothetical protein